MYIVDMAIQTFRIIGLSSIYFRRYPSLLLFPAFTLLVYCIIEAIVLFCMYVKYGIHIFNPESLELWSITSLWELGLVFAFFIAPLYCFLSFFVMISQAALAHAVIAIIEHKPFSIAESFKKSIACRHEIIKYAYLYTLLLILGETGIKRYLHRTVQQLGGSNFISSAKEDDWFELSFVIIPILVLEKLSIQHAIKKSCHLMQTTFGDPINSFFSFASIAVFFAFFIDSPLAHIVSKDTNGLIGISLFFLLLGVVMCAVRSFKGIFHAIVYQYCLGRSTDVFSHEFIAKSFVEEEFAG